MDGAGAMEARNWRTLLHNLHDLHHLVHVFPSSNQVLQQHLVVVEYVTIQATYDVYKLWSA